MRIVIDMQGAQTESRFRGIGRYSLSLAQAIARNRGEHEVLLALNGMFADSIDSIRAAFDDLIPQGDIHVWSAPGPVREADPSNRGRRQAAERIREAFLLDLRPDVVLLTSLFEGLGDDAVTSAGVWTDLIPTAVVLYDLIPLISPDISFRTSSIHKTWLAEKVASLRHCRLMLAISESSRTEALSALGASADDVVTVWGACDESFVDLGLSEAERRSAGRQVGIDDPFIMYTGGADERKNLFRLIQAYSQLPSRLQKRYQLAFVGKMPPDHVEALRAEALRLDVLSRMVFTGYVSDQALVRLYNSCALFVFPSLHEGLGLPPMEAMACGAAVIAADATSLPEVIGNPIALFDPTSTDAIARKIEQTLDSEAFQAEIIAHGRVHSRTFTWDQSGRLALDALRRFEPTEPRLSRASLQFERTGRYRTRRLRILVQKLDHRGDLILALPAIAKLRARYPHATIEALVGSWNMAAASALGIFTRIHPLDFYRSVSADAPALSQDEVDDVIGRLGHFDIAIDLRRQADTRFILVQVESVVRVGYESFDPVIDAGLHIRLESFRDVPFESTPLNEMHASQQMVNLVDAIPARSDDYIDLPVLAPATTSTTVRVAVFPSAGNEVKQWSTENFLGLARSLVDDAGIDSVELYFGSAKEAAPFASMASPKVTTHVGLAFPELVAALAGTTVCVANNSFGAHLAGYLGSTVVGIYGGHEKPEEWSPPFGTSYVIHADVECSPCHIASISDCPYDLLCLDSITLEAVLSKVLAACRGQKDLLDASAKSAERGSSQQIVDRLVADLARLESGLGGPHDRLRIAESVSANHRLISGRRQLLIDVSELARHDAKSGIQRVVRAILTQLLDHPPEGFSVEPVYLPADATQFSYAREFTAKFTGRPSPRVARDTSVDVWAGDVFLGLDLHPTDIPIQDAALQGWRRRGVRICFVLYDLLPVLMPQVFSAAVVDGHQRWLRHICRFDSVLAISRSVAEELVAWLGFYGAPRSNDLRIGWFHLGSDIAKSAPSTGLPEDAEVVLAAMSNRPSFLMVGTVEPRKGHALVLEAFEALWDGGADLNLVVVGKAGWMVEALARRMNSHAELGSRLFWVTGASDEYLERLYERSCALIAASVGEGFGLPLVEAAQKGLAILARDLPVFREVAQDHVSYFPANSDGVILAKHIRAWLARYAMGEHPRSDSMATLTWSDSAQQLLRCLVDEQWPMRWRPDGTHRFHGADERLHTSVGERRGLAIHTTGKGGHLIFGPYIELGAGEYQLRLWGEGSRWSRRDWFDIVHDGGRSELARGTLAGLKAGPWMHELLFSLNRDVRDFEIRLWVDESTVVSLDGLEITRRDGAASEATA